MTLSQNRISDIWESDSSSDDFVFIDEALGGSEVDGKHILARVVGPAFFPNSTSNNKVFYPEEAWEVAINRPEFQHRLTGRLVFGTIGHEIELDDDTVREGKFSHIVTKIWINEDNVGMAEYLVLNTPPGQILNTLLRAKSKLRVSTKAGGLFEPNVKNGVKSVIPESFHLERIDFVTAPGYNQALPELVESINKEFGQHKDYPMDTKVVDILEARVQELKEEKSITEAQSRELQGTVTTIKESLTAAQVKLGSFESLGTPAAIQESLSELEQYRAIGTVHQIHEALENGEETVDKLTDTVDSLKSELEERPAVDEDGDDKEAYKTLGSPEDIKGALEQAIGMSDELQTYRDLGSVEEIQQVLDNADQMTQTLESSEKSTICSKYGVTQECLDNMIGKGMSLNEADELLGQIKGALPQVNEEQTSAGAVTVTPTGTSLGGKTQGEDLPKPGAGTDRTFGKTAGKEVVQEENDDNSSDGGFNESLSSRLIRQFNHGKGTKKINESAGSQANQVLSRAARLMTGKR